MSKSIKLSIISTSAIFVFASFLALFFLTRPSTAQTTTANINITPNLLGAAGFTGVTIQPPQGTSFPSPLFYFRVKEVIPGDQGKAWGSSANLVGVLVEPKINRDWSYNNGEMEIKDFTGRTVVNLTSPGYFISVGGPDKTKVINLANRLKDLY